MTDKSRNFRSSYYDKVGFRGVEEKKSLEILINEKPMNKDKLSKFCLRYTLPTMYREFVWKVLLEVIPVNVENHKSVMDQRCEHYSELETSLKIMGKIGDYTSKPFVHALMFLMTTTFLDFNFDLQEPNMHVQNLDALASLFMKLGTSTIDSYWIFRNFVLQRSRFDTHFKIQKEKFTSILRKEDEVLYDHMWSTKSLEALPVNLWFGRYFSEVLHEDALVRICDKIIGGNSSILPFVGVAILLVKKHAIMSTNDFKKILNLFHKIPEDVSDVIVNKSLELCYS